MNTAVDLVIVYNMHKRFMGCFSDLYMAWDLLKTTDMLAYTPEEFQMMLQENPFIQDAVARGKVPHERSH